MLKSHETLIERLKKRADSGRGWLGTAESYVEEFAKCIHAGHTFGMSGEALDTARKHASNTLVIPGGSLEKSAATEAEFENLLPEGIVIPKNTQMVLVHKVTTPKEDRDKDVLRTDGAQLDPKSPLLWQHMHPLPLGKVITTLDHSKEVLRVASALLDLNELTSDAMKLVEADVLRFSHGFRALEWQERKSRDGMFEGFEITKFEIMEVSLVSVPSNTDAEMEMYAAGKLASDFFKAKAKSVWDSRPKSAPGVTFSQQQPAESKDTDGGDSGENTEPVAGEKRGATLSRANKAKLKEVRDDLYEIHEREQLSRGGKVLCKGCMKTLDEMLGEEDDDEGGDMGGDKPPMDDEKPKRDAETESKMADLQKRLDEAEAKLAEATKTNDTGDEPSGDKQASGRKALSYEEVLAGALHDLTKGQREQLVSVVKTLNDVDTMNEQASGLFGE